MPIHPNFYDKNGKGVSFNGDELGEKLGEKLGENQAKIIKLINRNKNITIKEMSNEIGISATAIENNIAKLKKKGILKRVGSDRKGYWKVMSEG